MYRELREEVGLLPEHVALLGVTKGWHRYRLPAKFIRKNETPICIGQKQKWFLLRMVGNEADIRFNCGRKPEFDYWQWVSYWYPLGQVVAFKREVYRRAMKELAGRHVRLLRDTQGSHSS